MQVIDKGLCDGERSVRERYDGFSFVLNLVELRDEMARDVGWIEGCGDGGDEFHLRELMRCGNHGGPTQGVAHQNGWGAVFLFWRSEERRVGKEGGSGGGGRLDREAHGRRRGTGGAE